MFFNNKKINKYVYGWKLYVNYGQGWEYETMELDWKSYKENRSLYSKNCSYPQRWNYGREINEEWQMAQNLLMVMVAINPLECE